MKVRATKVCTVAGLRVPKRFYFDLLSTPSPSFAANVPADFFFVVSPGRLQPDEHRPLPALELGPSHFRLLPLRVDPPQQGLPSRRPLTSSSAARTWVPRRSGCTATSSKTMWRPTGQSWSPNQRLPDEIYRPAARFYTPARLASYGINAWLYLSFARFITSVKNFSDLPQTGMLALLPFDFAGYDLLFCRPFVLGLLVAVYLQVR